MKFIGFIIGLIIFVCILALVIYKIRKAWLYLSPNARNERKLLKEKLSQEFAVCSACGEKHTKNKMKMYKIVDNEKDLGSYTENISVGLGGSRTYRRSQVFYHEGYICGKCDRNWNIACVIWLFVMCIGEGIAYLIYRIWFNGNVDAAVNIFIVATILSFFLARFAWRKYRIYTKCHIKILQ